MTMNIGGSYSMMGGMSGISMQGTSGAGGSGNMFQYYLNKYGCEDCFKKSPYPQEYPKPFTPEPKGALKPSLTRRFLNNVTGG